MTRVIHTGDTHIGYQQYHSQTRREDFLNAFRQVIADACDANVDAVVHAGDLFHDRRPSLPDLLGTIDILRDLREASIPFLAVVGNHESTRRGQWLDIFERIGLAERLDESPRYIDDDLALYGLDHVPPSRREDLEYQFNPHEATHAALVSHGLFTPFAHADWETETVLTEASVEFDALLLGDNHVPGIETVKDAWVTYCGSTERTSTTEESARGYNLVNFDTDIDIRRRSLETRPFVFISVDLSADEGSERVCDRLREHDLDDAVVVTEITGDGNSVPPATIETFATDHGALIARVTDRRDHPEEGDTGDDISFANPDTAVDQRIRELELSTAAHDIDTTIRSASVSDSNIRNTVTEDVSDLLTDESLNAFDPTSATETDTSTQTNTATTENVQSQSDKATSNHTQSTQQSHSTTPNEKSDVETDENTDIITDAQDIADTNKKADMDTGSDELEDVSELNIESESELQLESETESESHTQVEPNSNTNMNTDKIDSTEPSVDESDGSEDDQPDSDSNQFTMGDF
ncbi:DNA double-strand break repair protein Mre11 [Haloquadratum walsbyi]|jgi:DNA repair exonuclease|uniref:DNA double-strand break repair protein Mre11 n=1 Tax=Haloquadratum walsbyi J07HQW2 TaxID=1238425 RepID=U1NHT4_9EURY|nr:DNA double-strand break repair protein Mre11 [Haloquadratum walsbyi]ERG96745.1 MAG: DNA repair exonuclease [Haloquadratum walsbyi J07HQW2]